MGLNLLVKAEYNLAQLFDHNSFYVEGLDGMKYRYGITGALPLAFADKVQYPAMTLQRLPSIIENQRKKIARLEGELPVLMEIIGRSWSKADELARLKAECEALRRKIENDLTGGLCCRGRLKFNRYPPSVCEAGRRFFCPTDTALIPAIRHPCGNLLYDSVSALTSD